MAERCAGYISALPGCLGWGQHPDREKNREGFGFFGSRYQNTPFNGQLHPFVDPELRNNPQQSLSKGSLLPPSRRGGPNERYLSEADGQYHYYEDEGFWDRNGYYRFLSELGYFDDEGQFHIYNEQAELFELGCFADDGVLYFYREELDRINLDCLVQNGQRRRGGNAEHGKEQNARTSADSAGQEAENARANGTRDEQNGRADTIQNEETNPTDEYRGEGENPGGAENSVGDDQISVHEMDLESSDDGKEPQIRLPYLFPVVYPSSGPDQLDEEEKREGDCTPGTPPASENAGPSNSPTCCRSAPPDQINILCNIFDKASFKANTAPQKRSKDFIVSRRPGPVKGCSSFMASPNSLDPKHNTTEERRNTGKILGSVASTRHAWRPTVSSGLKRWGSSPHGSGNLHSAGPGVPPTSQRPRGKSETNRGSTSSHVSSVGQHNPRLSHLPARYRARKAGNVLVDKVVAEEMVEWAREDQEEAEAKKRNKEAKDQKPAEAKKRNKEAKPRQP